MSKKPLILIKDFADIEEKIETHIKKKNKSKDEVIKIAEAMEELEKSTWIYIENQLRNLSLLPNDYDSGDVQYTLSAENGVIFIEKDEEEKCCGGSCCSK